ncbi:MAG TPA: hypothetical protein VFE79_11825, partial [Paraburkholderia sp.]|nr:hypothetical protein [Paraburkholderia sp.]
GSSRCSALRRTRQRIRTVAAPRQHHYPSQRQAFYFQSKIVKHGQLNVKDIHLLMARNNSPNHQRISPASVVKRPLLYWE